jgi:hypothetical protein
MGSGGRSQLGEILDVLRAEKESMLYRSFAFLGHNQVAGAVGGCENMV